MGTRYVAYGIGYSGGYDDVDDARSVAKANGEGAVYTLIASVCGDCTGSGVGLRFPGGTEWACRLCGGSGWRLPHSGDDTSAALRHAIGVMRDYSDERARRGLSTQYVDRSITQLLAMLADNITAVDSGVEAE